MTSLLIASLCLSAILFTVSCLVPSDARTNWPLAVLAHLFWPVTFALILASAARARREAGNDGPIS